MRDGLEMMIEDEIETEVQMAQRTLDYLLARGVAPDAERPKYYNLENVRAWRRSLDAQYKRVMKYA